VKALTEMTFEALMKFLATACLTRTASSMLKLRISGTMKDSQTIYPMSGASSFM